MLENNRMEQQMPRTAKEPEIINKEEPITFEKPAEFLSAPKAIIIGSLFISLSILVSGGVIKIKGANLGQTATAGVQSPAPSSQSAQTNTGPVNLTVDKAPIEGSKDAPITVIEFSDYECPYCKLFYTQTLTGIRNDYIKPGKVKIAYKSYPLQFHDPLSTKESVAALCAKEQGGDTAYFKFHDLIFQNTTSNGNGLTVDNLYKYASDLSLNSDNFKSCLDSQKYQSDVQKDTEQGNQAGVNGTPTFFISKSNSDGVIQGDKLVDDSPASAPETQFKIETNDGTVVGYKIVGANPYSVFQSRIDALLK